jgi:ADP-ribosylglycohydrolase
VTLQERYAGALLGLAAGDALGTTLEFSPPGTFEPISDIIGGGPFGLQPGQWTDDTSMALCLAESLVACREFDAADQMRRYVRWYREGHLSSTGHCFDIGGTTSHALHSFERSGEPFSGPCDEWSAGNGSLMRLAPVPLAFADDPVEAVRLAGESSRTTHGAREAVDACRYFAALLVGAVAGVSKEELLSSAWSPVAGLWETSPLAPRIEAVAAGSFRHKQPPAICGRGYVVDALEAALWAVHGASTFRDACLRAVNLGDDADTTGAIAGQLAGAFWGTQGDAGIPASWLNKLAHADRIIELANGLWLLAKSSGSHAGETSQ